MRRMSLLLIALVVAAACAVPGGDPSDGAGAEPSLEVPATLLPDGSVPWADLKITTEDLNGPPPTPRAPAPGSGPCRAEQLSGQLSSWWRPSGGGESPRGMDAAVGRLIGEVEVTNISGDECTLQGEVPTTMLVAGREIPMLYSHGINEEARARVVAVPPGGRASMRLDWSGPFCEVIDGPLELAIELPHRGGTLRVPVTAEGDPGCQRGEWVNPNLRAALHASGFTEPRVASTTPYSPLSQLTVAITGPATATAGAPLRLRVTLGNPTDGPLALDPCPGYLMEVFSLGDAVNEPVNTSQLYRLNCRPLPEIPAGGAGAFEMIVPVPDSMRAGRELSVTWKLFLPQYAQGPNQYARYSVRVA